ncbi:glycosyltransferase, partial [Patescibacteria group bacterium]|nr:glycosyltransferase [Patescibacteria group bacterium]
RLIFLIPPILFYLICLDASVVIPAFNEEKFIGACLRSLRAQTVPPSEIIVVDNGSTDRTVEIAEKLADRVIIIPDVGVVTLRQAGADAAKNQIIVSTDADTTHPDFWIEKLLRHFSDPDVVAVGGSIRASIPGPMEDLYAKGLSASASAGMFSGANMAFRRDALLKSGGYVKVKRAEDWALSTRLRNQGRIVYDPEAYVFTDVPFNRQLEFAALAANAGLLGIGATTRSPGSLGFSSGFYLASLGTIIDNVPDGLHHSQIAVAGLGLLSLFRGSMSPYRYKFLAGLLSGILGHHFVTEDVYDPVWIRINGSLFAGVTLLLAST